MKTDNELIAEFIGIKPSGYFRGDDLDPKYKNGDFVQTGWGRYHHSELKYNESWDWLMPVVEKIENLHAEKFHYDPAEMIKGNFPKDSEYLDVICLPLSVPISEAYEAILKFIKWHNENLIH